MNLRKSALLNMAVTEFVVCPFIRFLMAASEGIICAKGGDPRLFTCVSNERPSVVPSRSLFGNEDTPSVLPTSKGCLLLLPQKICDAIIHFGVDGGSHALRWPTQSPGIGRKVRGIVGDCPRELCVWVEQHLPGVLF